MLKTQPQQITACQLECVLMPQGEILCLGKTIGWFKSLKNFLTVNDPAIVRDLTDYLEEIHHSNINAEGSNIHRHHKEEPACTYCQAIKKGREALERKS